MKAIQLARVVAPGAGVTVQLMTERNTDYRFEAHFIRLRFDVTFVNSVVGAEVVGARLFCFNSKLNWKYRDNTDFLTDLPWLMQEGEQMLQTRGSLPGALVECVDKVINAGVGATTVATYYLDVPLALPLAERPSDFAMSPAFLGPCQVKIGSTGNPNVVVSTTTVEIVAYGFQKSYCAMGSRCKVTAQASLAPLNEDKFVLSDDRLVSLMVATSNAATSPIASTSPRVRVDAQAEFVDFPDDTTLEAQKFIGQVAYGPFAARSTLVDTSAAVLVHPGSRFHIADLPRGSTVNTRYASNPATAGTHFLIGRAVVAVGGPCIRKALPPALQAMSPAEFDRKAITPTIDPAGGIDPDIAPFLPTKLYHPELIGLCS